MFLHKARLRFSQKCPEEMLVTGTREVQVHKISTGTQNICFLLLISILFSSTRRHSGDVQYLGLVFPVISLIALAFLVVQPFRILSYFLKQVFISFFFHHALYYFLKFFHLVFEFCWKFAAINSLSRLSYNFLFNVCSKF